VYVIKPVAKDADVGAFGLRPTVVNDDDDDDDDDDDNFEH